MFPAGARGGGAYGREALWPGRVDAWDNKQMDIGNGHPRLYAPTHTVPGDAVEPQGGYSPGLGRPDDVPYRWPVLGPALVPPPESTPNEQKAGASRSGERDPVTNDYRKPSPSHGNQVAEGPSAAGQQAITNSTEERVPTSGRRQNELSGASRKTTPNSKDIAERDNVEDIVVNSKSDDAKQGPDSATSLVANSPTSTTIDSHNSQPIPHNHASDSRPRSKSPELTAPGEVHRDPELRGQNPRKIPVRDKAKIPMQRLTDGHTLEQSHERARVRNTTLERQRRLQDPRRFTAASTNSATVVAAPAFNNTYPPGAEQYGSAYMQTVGQQLHQVPDPYTVHQYSTFSPSFPADYPARVTMYSPYMDRSDVIQGYREQFDQAQYPRHPAQTDREQDPTRFAHAAYLKSLSYAQSYLQHKRAQGSAASVPASAGAVSAQGLKYRNHIIPTHAQQTIDSRTNPYDQFPYPDSQRKRLRHAEGNRSYESTLAGPATGLSPDQNVAEHHGRSHGDHVRLFQSRQTQEQRDRIFASKRMFVCPHCGHIFSCSSNLNRHKRVHTGDKPYKCAHCEVTFSNSSNRRKHELKCTANEASEGLHTTQQNIADSAINDNQKSGLQEKLDEHDSARTPTEDSRNISAEPDHSCDRAVSEKGLSADQTREVSGSTTSTQQLTQTSTDHVKTVCDQATQTPPIVPHEWKELQVLPKLSVHENADDADANDAGLKMTTSEDSAHPGNSSAVLELTEDPPSPQPTSDARPAST